MRAQSSRTQMRTLLTPRAQQRVAQRIAHHLTDPRNASKRDRHADPLHSPAVWTVTLLVALFGAMLRFIRLDQPHELVFDETYYVKDAWTMLNTGEARDWPDTVPLNGQDVPVDELFAQGDTNRWLPSAEYVVHPPFGKWLIATGLKLFGGAGNPFAWRAAVALAGVVCIILLMRIALRLFHNTSIAVLAGVLLSIDGVGITLSRTGLLDNFLALFALAASSLLLVHRDQARARLERCFAEESTQRNARWIPDTHRRTHRQGKTHDNPNTASPALLLDAPGPCLAFSWPRAGAVLMLGFATGIKWSGAYLFAVFMTISVLWDAWNRREVGYRPWFRFGVLRDGLLAALWALPLYALIYLADWLNWFIHPDSYMHNWAAANPGKGWTWLPESLRSFIAYHQEMWQFHTTLDSPHTYKANPLTWPIQWRPTSFYWNKLDSHPGLCSLAPRSQCVEAVTSLGNPIIWWLGCICTVAAIIIAIAKRGDWRIWAVLAGFLGGWLPWVQYLNRTTFTFYSVVLLPWMILAICYTADWLRTSVSRTAWQVTYGVTLGICLLASAFFYPIWTAMPVPYEFWLSHMWFPSWI